MTILDIVYDEFIKFLNENKVIEYYNQGLLQRYNWDASNKFQILVFMSPSIIDSTLTWSQTPIRDDKSWSSLNNQWDTRYYRIFQEVQVSELDPTPLYYMHNSMYEREIGNAYDVMQSCNILKCSNLSSLPSKLIPLGLRKTKTEYTLFYGISDHFLSTIVDKGIPLELIPLNQENLLVSSTDFYKTIKAFSSKVLSAIWYPRKELPFNYLNVNTETGKVSYLPKEKDKDVPEDEKYISKKRRETSMGRLLVRLAEEGFLDKCDIERASNFFSGLSKAVNIEIWDADRIREAYLEENYSPKMDCINSTLHNSCMRHPGCQDFFDFYKAAHAQIAVLLDENKKVLSRAILWKVNEDTYYLDRIYSTSPFYYIRFANAVKEKVNLKYYRVDGEFYDASTNKVLGEMHKLEPYILQTNELKTYEGLYPYMDTFHIYIPSLGIITNSGAFALRSTEGNRSRI